VAADVTGRYIKEMAGDFARPEKLHPIDFGGHKRVIWTLIQVLLGN